MTTCAEILNLAETRLRGFEGDKLDVLDVSRPGDLDYAIHLAKVVSKLSPMLGNMIEYRVVQELNDEGGWPGGQWHRQDPGFPDTVFLGDVSPTPGIEIKTWFPLATEITARFKDSVLHFAEDQTNVVMVAWLPDHLIFGVPQIVGVWSSDAKSVAQARDLHYHKPPRYLVFEPEDTSNRTRNLQQTNTNGYRFQGTSKDLAEAQALVDSWEAGAMTYSADPDYQGKMRTLTNKFKYRLDTNFAKMDRIEHQSLEKFKSHVLDKEFLGRPIRSWAKLLRKPGDPETVKALRALIS